MRGALEIAFLVCDKKATEAERVLMSEAQGEKSLGEIKTLHELMPTVRTDPLNGIIAQLTRECGGNVHAKGLVEVTSSTRPTHVYGHSRVGHPATISRSGA